MELSVTSIIIYLTVICFAAAIHGAIGIGFLMVATPLLTMAADVKTAILLLVLPTIFINAANVISGGSWAKSHGRYWPLALYSMIGSVLGTRLLLLAPADLFRPLLAGIIILYLNAERIGLGFSWIISRPKMAMAVFGMVAGVLGGTVNVMLPPLVIFSLETKMNKIAMIQVFNLCLLAGKLGQWAVLIYEGEFTLPVAEAALPLAIIALSVTFASMKLRNRIQAETYRKWLRRLLAVMAGVLLLSIFRG
ncbi:MAG: hypothetical protein CSA29_01935 [Desulfobacterales bacterium]|nr:MAG: hypothetical protein CSA29_01935 [Desulfobacterales bacterium]